MATKCLTLVRRRARPPRPAAGRSGRSRGPCLRRGWRCRRAGPGCRRGLSVCSTAPGARGRVVELEVAIAVPGERGDPVAALHAEPCERVGHAPRARRELAVGACDGCRPRPAATRSPARRDAARRAPAAKRSAAAAASSNRSCRLRAGGSLCCGGRGILQRRAAGIIREWPGLSSRSSFAASPRRPRSRRRRPPCARRSTPPSRVNPRLRGYVLDDQGAPAAERGRLHRRPAQPGPAWRRPTRSARRARSTCCRRFPEAEARWSDRAPGSRPARACSSCAGRRRGWARARRASFLGEPVVDAAAAATAGRMLAALNLGHFGVKLHALRRRRRELAELAAPAYPEQPADARRAGLEARRRSGRSRERGGTVWAGTLPGGLFRSADRGRVLAAGRAAVEPARARSSGSAAATTRPASIRSARIRSDDRELLRRHQLRRRLGDARRRRQLGAAGRRHARRLHAAGAGAATRTSRTRTAIVRSAGRPDGALVPASQRHLPLDRRRRELARDHERAAVELRLRRRRRIRATPTAPGSCPASPTSSACRSARALAVNRTRDGGSSFETLRAGLPQARLLRPRLSPRPRGRCRRRAAADGEHHRQLLGQRRRRRELAARSAQHLPPVYAVRIG